MHAVQTAAASAIRFHPALVQSTTPGGAQAGPARLFLARDAEIFAQESRTRRVYRIISGAARTVRLMPDGRRQVGAFHFPGDWLGVEAGPAHRFAAEAVSDCALEAHDRIAGQPVCSHPELGPQMIEATMCELARAQDHLLLLGRKTAEEKVATFLRDLDLRGVHDLPMRRQDIADYLGLTIETVSRMLTQLQNAGVVRICNLRRPEVLDGASLDQLAA